MPITSDNTLAVKSQSPLIQSEDKLRVSVNLLNDLVDLASELVLSRNHLVRGSMGMSELSSDFTRGIQKISWVTTELQQKIMHLRMQPLSVLFSKFPRVVRDLSREFHKEIELQTSGDDVELDKSIIESLVDPLTHLVRNSVDHGVELPSVRSECGKSRTGTIRFDAVHESGLVHLTISDDGGGIRVDKVVEKAIANGLMTQAEASEMSEREKLRLIFRSGFSTADKVTKVSGRGVGMDVVLTNVEAAGGMVDIETTPGKGTKFHLLLPLTVAIVHGLVVRVSKSHFIIPQTNITELVRIRPDEVERRLHVTDQTKVLRLRNDLVPILDLRDHLKLPYVGAVPNGSLPQILIILRLSSRLLALQVDGVESMEEVVIKPMPIYFQKLKIYNGSTVLGDGSVALMLDSVGLAEAVGLDKFEVEDANKSQTDLEATLAEERIPLLVFSNGGVEPLAVPLSQVSRIEKILWADVEWLNGVPFYRFRDATRRLIQLENYLPIGKKERKKEIQP